MATFETLERQTILKKTVQSLSKEQLQWLVFSLLSPMSGEDLHEPLNRLSLFLDQADVDFLFKELAHNVLSTVSAQQFPTTTYHQLRLVDLIKKLATDLGSPEEGEIFSVIANECEQSFSMFWDGRVQMNELERNKQRVWETGLRIVKRALLQLGTNYFNFWQRRLLSGFFHVEKIEDLIGK